MCCCLRRDVDARNGSGRVLGGGGRNHEVTLSMCAVGEQLPTFSVLIAECYIVHHAFALLEVFILSQLSLNFNIIYWDLVLLLLYYY